MVTRSSVSKGHRVSLLIPVTQALSGVILSTAGLWTAWMGATWMGHRRENRTQLCILMSYLGFRVSCVVCSVLAASGIRSSYIFV